MTQNIKTVGKQGNKGHRGLLKEIQKELENWGTKVEKIIKGIIEEKSLS